MVMLFPGVVSINDAVRHDVVLNCPEVIRVSLDVQVLRISQVSLGMIILNLDIMY